jgi:hypothetical protein
LLKAGEGGSRTVKFMIVIGTPAGYTKQLRAKNLLRCAAGAGTSALTGIVVAAAPSTLSTLHGAVGLLSVFVAGSVVCRSHWVKVRKNQVGIDAEITAARALTECGALAVAFGARLSHGDCDAVALGPQLVAIEVKYGKGAVRLERGALRDDRKSFGRDPLRQATDQAKALGGLAGSYADAVVCVVGMTNQPFFARNVTVCSERHLAEVVRKLPQRLSRPQAEALSGILAEAS